MNKNTYAYQINASAVADYMEKKTSLWLKTLKIVAEAEAKCDKSDAFEEALDIAIAEGSEVFEEVCCNYDETKGFSGLSVEYHNNLMLLLGAFEEVGLISREENHNILCKYGKEEINIEKHYGYITDEI